MLHCFIEGPDDETFFKKIFSGIEVDYYQYSQKQSIKVNKYIQTIKQINEPYIFFADADGDSYQSKKDKILNKFQAVNTDNLFIVQYEIESWFLAGVDKPFCDRNKIKKYYSDTNSITKEMFENVIKNTGETKLSMMLKMLNDYSYVLAGTRNDSFKKFFDKNMSICT